LGHFESVCEAVADVIRKAGSKNLGLVHHPPERACVHGAMAVANKGIAIGVGGFRIAPSPAPFDIESKTGQGRRNRHLI
jgi:hypothetical protein